MEFRHLEAFIAVAETRSFTSASERMNLSQPAVSQLVRRLEEEFGEKLFHRGKYEITITDRGTELLPNTRKLLDIRKNIISSRHRDPATLRGNLRVGTSTSATTYLWAEMYRSFARKYPLINLDIKSTSHTEKTKEDILLGKLDIGFLPFPHGESRLGSLVLGQHRAVLVASPDNKLSSFKKIPASSLNKEPFLLYERGINFRVLSDRFFDSNGITPGIAAQSNDTHLIKTLTQLDFGLSFLPDWAVQEELASGKLIEIDVENKNMTEEIGLAFLNAGISSTAQVFLDFCRYNPQLVPETARKMDE